MSIQDEYELRDRLGGLLHGIEPGLAPVAGTMRRGKGIRMRRWISAAAGLAVVTAGAVIVPGQLQHHPATPTVPPHYSVTVSPVSNDAKAGLIGQGTTDGHPWQAVLSAQNDGRGVMVTGFGWPGFGSYQSVADQFTASPAALTTVASGQTVLEFGTVRADVTNVVISLPDGEAISIRPVTWHGRRWVAIQLPERVPIVKAVLYTARGELAYAVPFGDTELVVWWRPGQVGPARLTKTFGSGVLDGKSWRAVAQIGPWGYCFTFGADTDCLGSTSPQVLSAGALVSVVACGSFAANVPGGPIAGFAATAVGVRRVVFTYADGSTTSYPTFAVGPNRMFGYAVPGNHKIAKSQEYGSAGQLLGSTSGATWRC
jgi:hypothetical protein